MRANFAKRVSFVLVVLLIAALAAGMCVSLTCGVAVAESTLTQTGVIDFVHMSDIHYFPIDYCYQNVASADYEESEFFHSMTGDTKLVLESGVILNNAVRQVIAEAKDGTAPHYFLATGDLCKNGEREALIDVANALRYMQNQVRTVSGYENFQVLAQVGNHDLYNTDAALYSKDDGTERVADTVTADQFALIFAGLGFPNASLDGDDSHVGLKDYLPEKYWASEYTDGYQQSDNASNLTITYFNQNLAAVQDMNKASGSENSAKLEKYFSIGDAINQLSYTVKINDNPNFGFMILDSTDREATDEGKPVRMSESEYKFYNRTDLTVYIGEDDGSIDMSKSFDISKETDKKAVTAAFAAGKAVYRATDFAHITGGRLTEGVLNFAQQFANGMPKDSDSTLIAACHHNILPHFEQEDDILKDFTLYNWEYTANRFLDMGVRYVFTGHQHSSDIAKYTDILGRTLYDSETGSMVSYESPRRYVTITRNTEAGNEENIEKMTSLIRATDEGMRATDEGMRATASTHITTASAWNDKAYKDAYAAYEQNPNENTWKAVVDANPDYLAYTLKYDEINKFTYNEYIGKDIYTRLVDRVLDHFLSDSTVDGLVESLGDMIGGLKIEGAMKTALENFLGLTPGSNGSLKKVAMYVVDLLINDLYQDGEYPYKGETYHGIVEWLRAIVDDLVNMEFGDASIQSEANPTNAGKLTLKEMAGFIMMAHSTGTEVSLSDTYAEIDAEFDEKQYDDPSQYKNPLDKTYRKRMVAALKDAHQQLTDGTFAGNLFDALLDPLFNNEDSLLKRLLNMNIDFEDAVDKGFLDYSEFVMFQDAMSELPTTFNENSEFIIAMLGGLLKADIQVPDDFELSSIDVTKFNLGTVINELLPVIKPLVANMIGFNLDGPDLITIVENALHGYITQSFKVGLGGIADKIVMSYATDDFPDVANIKAASKPYLVTPHADYKKGGEAVTYASSLDSKTAVGNSLNPATQDNGRVPSRIVANFDTVNSTTSYTFKFYTAENVYGTFKFKDSVDGEWKSVSTKKSGASGSTDYLDSKAEAQFGDVKVTMLTQTKPAYVPLIDLGLACLTHGEIVYEDADGNEIPFIFGQRDDAPKASVIYWNVTTVTVTGLKPATTYYYDLEGNFELSDGSIQMSAVQYAKLNGYDKDHYTFKTAADDKVEEFEFLTIADIQGMIQGMYDDSYAAVKALLADERTNNFDFLLNAGDMVDNGKNFNQWAMALDTYQTLFANTSQFFAAGNHEDGKNAFATYFNYTLPVDEENNRLQDDITDGAFYSFNYGTAHFTVLNTNDATSNGLGEIQLKWLEKDLSESKAKWKFVLMHKSIFSGGSHSTDAEVVAMRAQLVPLFNKYGVNMVFAGHDHTYTTTHLVKADGSVEKRASLDGLRYTGDGVLFVTLGTLGTKYYEYGENPDVTPKFNKDDSILHTLDSQTFGKVKVTKDEIVFTGYYYNRETGKLDVIGSELTLVNEPVMYASTLLGLAIGIPVAVVVAAIVVAVVLILKKKGVIGKKAEAAEQTTDAEQAEETAELEENEEAAGENGEDTDGENA